MTVFDFPVILCPLYLVVYLQFLIHNIYILFLSRARDFNNINAAQDIYEELLR
jgi:hypothetical protein